MLDKSPLSDIKEISLIYFETDTKFRSIALTARLLRKRKRSAGIAPLITRPPALLPISGILFIAPRVRAEKLRRRIARDWLPGDAKKRMRTGPRRRHAADIHLENVPAKHSRRGESEDAFYEPRTREYRVPITEQGTFPEVSETDGLCAQSGKRTKTCSRRAHQTSSRALIMTSLAAICETKLPWRAVKFKKHTGPSFPSFATLTLCAREQHDDARVCRRGR